MAQYQQSKCGQLVGACVSSPFGIKWICVCGLIALSSKGPCLIEIPYVDQGLSLSRRFSVHGKNNV